MKAQALKFNHIVETLYSLPLEERLEIMTLLEHNIADTRRNEIANNFKQSQQELKSGKLKFTSKIEDLKRKKLFLLISEIMMKFTNLFLNVNKNFLKQKLRKINYHEYTSRESKYHRAI